MAQKGSLFGATLLVTGTAVGAGMLALPVATGQAGFFPAMLLMLSGWAFMTLTALFLIEANLWMKPGSHIVTMANTLLGRWGRYTAWIFYLFVSYASLVAYTAGCGDLLQMAALKLLGFKISTPLAATFFVFIFGFIIYLGNVVVGRVNALLVGGLVLSYLLLIGGGFPHIQWNMLLRGAWGPTGLCPNGWVHSLVAAPLLLSIFSFQTIVPSLTIYLQRDGRKLRLACILGTTIALIIYLVWQALVLGTVLWDGDYGLAKALALGKPATEFLSVALNSPQLSAIADFFAFFCLVTSFLGMGLGLFDFLADGLKVVAKGINKVWLVLLVAIPPLLCAIAIERIFLLALDISGGLGDTVINGFLPAMMLWAGRYWKKMKSENPIPGGRPLIIAVMAYAAFVFALEVLGKFGIGFCL